MITIVIKGKMYNVSFFMDRFLLTMNLEFIDQGNLKVYMNQGKAIAYFIQPMKGAE